jgi:hypothetical protein
MIGTAESEPIPVLLDRLDAVKADLIDGRSHSHADLPLADAAVVAIVGGELARRHARPV